MHDVKAIREDPDAFVRGWRRRGTTEAETVVQRLLALDQGLRAAQTAFQAAQSRRNEASRLIGKAKARQDEAEAARLMSEVEELKGALAEEAAREAELGARLRGELAGLPNLPSDEVPDGEDERSNLEVRRVGDPSSGAAAADHVDLGERLGLMDFEAARRMSGARFVVLRGALARLERALGQFMIDLQTQEHGYTEIAPPLLVRPEASFGVGHLPKFEADQFWAVPGGLLEEFGGEDLPRLREGRYGLIPTAEVSLTNLVREQLLAEESLPLRLAALTPCFRSEAGASGRDTRGMIRQHQFWKCELVSVTAPEASEAEHERMTECAEEVLKRLELPFRRMLLCAGDMGFSAQKTYDLEVWLPSARTYREISSCSNCGDFQARRMDARFRRTGEKGGRFVHTLNGSGLAVGRTLVAVLETYQDQGGGVSVPEALWPYMGGLRRLEAAA